MRVQAPVSSGQTRILWGRSRCKGRTDARRTGKGNENEVKSLEGAA